MEEATVKVTVDEAWRYSGNRLRFLVAVANLTDDDLSTLREGDRLNLIADLRGYTFDTTHADETLKKARARIELIKPALVVIREFIAATADHRVVDVPAGTRPRFRYDARQADAQPVMYLDVAAPLVERILETVVGDLRTASVEEISRIRRCKDTKKEVEHKDGPLFYATRADQDYCGRACAARAAVRAWSAKRKAAR